MIVAEFVIVAVLLAVGAYAVSVLIALFTDCKVKEDAKFLQMEEVKASAIGKQANWAWMTLRWKYTELRSFSWKWRFINCRLDLITIELLV